MMRARRGSALILVLMMTLAIAGLSIAAIFMSSSAGLLSAFYDRERTYRLAAEAGLEMARSRLNRDSTLAIPDTGVRQLIAGTTISDANGTLIPSVRVNVYAAGTGDTTGAFLPHVTLIAAAYDAGGTRHVSRLDLRRESFSRYGIFTNAFPSGQSQGPGVVSGRVHTNQTWRSSTAGNIYRDTVSAVTDITGTATYERDTLRGVVPIRYPRDSVFARLDTIAATGNLAFTPLTGSGVGSRLEFVSFDANNDATVGASEGFVRIFDLANGIDTTRLKATPPVSGFSPFTYHAWNDPIVQNQCGVFYLRAGRWHFFPVSTHRAAWAENVIRSNASFNYPRMNNPSFNQMRTYDYNAVVVILSQPTARCFPAGSPFLMPAERMTNPSGVVTGTAADTVPWGVSPSITTYYGGSDSTFTVRSRTCTFSTAGNSGRCNTGTIQTLGSWRAFGGTPVTGISGSVRQAVESPYLWPLTAPFNPNSRGVVSARAGPLFVSGSVRGRVTLRVAGRATLVDRLKYDTNPNDPATAACSDQLGLIATGDILVVDGLTSRVRRIGQNFLSSQTWMLGGEERFSIHGSLMSLGGTVGAENPGLSMGTAAAASQLTCPDGGASGTASNGGCLAVTGGMVMNSFTSLYTSTLYSGFRYDGKADRCQSTTRRPPFFPLTNRYTLVRSLSLLPSDANTPAKIRTILMRLKGRPL